MRCNGYQTFYCILPQSRFAAILPFKIGHLHFVELMVFVTFLVILLGLPFFDRNERTIDVQSPIFFLITIQQNLHVLEFNLKLKKKINQSHRRVQMDLLLSKANHATWRPKSNKQSLLPFVFRLTSFLIPLPTFPLKYTFHKAQHAICNFLCFISVPYPKWQGIPHPS